MLHFLQNKYSPIGLDIGQTAIRAVQLRRQAGQQRLHVALELPCKPLSPTTPATPSVLPAQPPASVHNHDLADTDTEALPNHSETDSGSDEQFIHLLKSLVSRARFPRRDVVLHCPSDKMGTRPVKLPTGPQGLAREAILGALRLQLADSLSMPLEQAVFDYFIIENRPEQREITVMSTVADRQWITHRIDLVRAAGLRCIAVDALPCALGRLTNIELDPTNDDAPPTQESQQETQGPEQDDDVASHTMRALLDIGYSGSTLVVMKGAVPVFSRRFSLGGYEMTAFLAQRLGISTEQAEALKVAYGLDFTPARSPQILAPVLQAADLPDSPQAAPLCDAPQKADRDISSMIFDVLETNLNEYLLALTRSLNYAINEHHGQKLADIILCGSAAHTLNLDQYLAQQFDLPAHVADHPLLNEIVEPLPRTRAQAGTWTTALGLALTEEAP